MDLSQISLEDAAPLMRNIEHALRDELVEMLVFRDDSDNTVLARMSRKQCEVFLLNLERHFFAKAN